MPTHSAPAVYVKENNVWKLYYICRDYLGSITHITTEFGELKQELSYDAWGRLRDPNNQELYAVGDEPNLFLNRGYTGHEHLAMFGLINMNARLYDPVVGRFLSPDPYVQSPDMSQNFNRYSYCLNNPLKYNDESGEFFGAFFGLAGGFFKGIANVIKGKGIEHIYQDTWKGFINGLKIDAGLLLHIPVWETLQTSIGYYTAIFRNTIGLVDNVEIDLKRFSVLVNDNDPSTTSSWGYTSGPYINSKNMTKGNSLYMHEVGHRRQSFILGSSYTFVVSIPSVITFRACLNFVQ